MNKRVAEKTEAELLDKFDYAWNKGSNGARRPYDILQRLDRSTLENSSNHLRSRILKFGMSQPRLVSFGFGVNEDHTSICGVALGHGSVCIRPPVEGRQRCAPEHKGMKINGSIPKLITEGKSPGNDVSMGSGIIRAPECDGHSKKNYAHGPVLESRARFNDYEQIAGTCKPDRLQSQVYSNKSGFSISYSGGVNKDFSPTCGATLQDGYFC